MPNPDNTGNNSAKNITRINKQSGNNTDEMHSLDRISLQGILKSLPVLLLRAPRAVKAIPILNPRNEFLSLGKIIAHKARHYPNNVFIYFEGRKITYKEFNDYSNKSAHFLAQQGIRKGDVVALLMDNRPEFLIYAVAIVKLGAIAALLNASQKGQVLTHSINLVKAKSLIVGEELLGIYQEVSELLVVDAEQRYFVSNQNLHEDFGKAPQGLINLPEQAESFPNNNPPQTSQVHRKDSCFYIYTSGTTGMPKASITNHERWLAAHAGLGHAIVQLKPEDIFYCPLPFYHATAMLVCWGTIIAGASSLVLKRKFSASEFWKDVQQYKVTAFGYIGELCRYLLNQPLSAHDQNHSVRLIMGNGLRPSLWKEFKNRFGIKRVIEFYGASEGNAVFINLFNMDNTIGIGGTNLALVKYDKESELPLRDASGKLQKVNKGEAGLLLGKVTAITPFAGYTDKNQSKKALIENAFKAGDQWFNTGDLVRNIGYHHFQFVDRLGDTFRWKGENVSTTELENICLQFQGIQDCVAYGVEIPETNGKAGMLSVSLLEKNHLDFISFLDFLNKNLPAYAIPRFIRLKQEVDTTETFKYKKADLKEQAYHLEKVKDPLFVLLPDGKQQYSKLTPEIYASIVQGEYRF